MINTTLLDTPASVRDGITTLIRESLQKHVAKTFSAETKDTLLEMLLNSLRRIGSHDEIAVKVTSVDDRARVINYDLSMSPQTWNRVFVPMGYAPVSEEPIPCIEITVTVSNESKETV